MQNITNIRIIPSSDTIKKITLLSNSFGLPHSDFDSHPHCTIIYSPDFIDADAIKLPKFKIPIIAKNAKLEIFETDSRLGRVLTLDDLMMTTEGDEWNYHEMIAHVPMMHHKCPKTVLVIGGGDGGTVREVLKHDTVEKVVLCEIDGMVIDVCKKYLPTIGCELDNPKVEMQLTERIYSPNFPIYLNHGFAERLKMPMPSIVQFSAHGNKEKDYLISLPLIRSLD